MSDEAPHHLKKLFKDIHESNEDFGNWGFNRIEWPKPEAMSLGKLKEAAQLAKDFQMPARYLFNPKIENEIIRAGIDIGDGRAGNPIVITTSKSVGKSECFVFHEQSMFMEMPDRPGTRELNFRKRRWYEVVKEFLEKTLVRWRCRLGNYLSTRTKS